MRSSLFKSNKYTKWYFQIIYKSWGQNRKRGSEYFEEHHIIPKKLGGSNSKYNLVLLTAREHFIVHWLLTKCFEGGSKAEAKMVHAFWRTTNTKVGQRNYSSRYYEIARKKFVEQVSLNLPEEEIIDLYINKKLSTPKIAKKFNCNSETILNLLKKNSINIRERSESILGKSKLNEFKDEIINLYNRGISTYQIAKKFNCGSGTIGRLLKRNKVNMRTAAETNNFKLKQYKADIIDLYINHKIPTTKLAKYYNCDNSTIGKFLKRCGIKMRSFKDAYNKVSILEQYKDEIIDLYRQGLTTYKIAEKFKCGVTTVNRLLKRNNVK